MSQRASAIMWLGMAAFCGFLTLVCCAGGGYGIWHTQTRLQAVEKAIEEDDKAIKEGKLAVKKAEEADKRLKENDKEKAELDKYRIWSFAGTGIGILPGLVTFIFLIMGALTWFKKPRVKVEEESEEDEEEEVEEPTPPAKPAPKAKQKPRRKDDD